MTYYSQQTLSAGVFPLEQLVTAPIIGVAPSLRFGSASAAATNVGGLIALLLLNNAKTSSGLNMHFRIAPGRNERAIALLKSWMDEDGDTKASDFDEQVRELNSSRMSLKKP